MSQEGEIGYPMGRRRSGRARKRGGRGPGAKRAALILSIAIALSATIYVARRPAAGGLAPGRRAALIDGLSVDYPNPEFEREAVSILRGMGFEVDVYNGSEVTVDLYRRLPAMGYDLVILRVHAAPMDSGGGVALFTAEPCDRTSYLTERLVGWVRNARTLDERKCYLAVTPDFIVEGTEGAFDGAAVVVSSCFGSIDEVTARAFFLRGASTFVGWDGYVGPGHTDRAILSLLSALASGSDIEGAVGRAMSEVGGDPAYNSTLRLITRGGG